MRLTFPAVLSTGVLAVTMAACDGDKGSSITTTGPTGPSAHIQGDSGGGGGGSPVTKYQSDGDAAYLNWFSYSSGDSTSGGFAYEFGYLSVQRGGTPQAKTTFLSYSLTSCSFDPLYYYTCSDVEAGYGNVRNADLSIAGKQWRLKVSTANNPGLVVWAGSGSLDITFNTLGLYSTSSNGVTTTKYGNLTVETNGQSTSASASVTGRLGAATVPPQTYGSVGSSKQITIWHFHS